MNINIYYGYRPILLKFYDMVKGATLIIRLFKLKYHNQIIIMVGTIIEQYQIFNNFYFT
jgi:hypothetical protein